jgi:carbon storage regulator
MLILSRKTHESIMIGDQIEISVVDIKGDQVKLGIDAPRNVKVFRQEVYQAIQLENRAAAQTGTDLPQIETMLGPQEQKNSSQESQ